MGLLDFDPDDIHTDQCESTMGPPGPFPCNCDIPGLVACAQTALRRIAELARTSEDDEWHAVALLDQIREVVADESVFGKANQAVARFLGQET